MKLAEFANEVVLCIARQNGFHLAELFAFGQTSLHSPLAVECHRLQLDPNEQVETFRTAALGERKFGPDAENSRLWQDLVSHYLRALMRMHAGQPEDAFAELTAALQLLHRICTSCSRWILPLLHTLNDSIWLLSLSTNRAEEGARLINKSLTVCLTDRAPLTESRKWGVYRCAARLFRAYFYLGQLNLGANVLRALGVGELPALQRFPKAHTVEYRYWLGKFWFVAEEYTKACGELQLAWAECPQDALLNKRLILHLLLPLNVLTEARHPSSQLLQRYNMPPFYAAAISAIKLGDLCAYASLLEAHDAQLLKLGTFLIWEKLTFFAYRNLLRRIFLIRESNTRLLLSSLVSPLKWMKQKKDLDGIATMIATLITKGFIKGYISQEKATLVLSQKDPFPPLSTVNIADSI